MSKQKPGKSKKTYVEGKPVSVYESFYNANVEFKYSDEANENLRLHCLSLSLSLVEKEIIKLDEVMDQTEAFVSFVKNG